MSKKINAAIVGFGLSGKAFHAPFLDAHPGFELKKVLERHGSESQKMYPAVEVVRGFNDIISDSLIDLVVICTPNTLHFEQVKACLDAGKHVVIEKPFMNSSADCDEIIQYAEKKNLNLFVYQNRRWDGDFLTLKKILESGVLGDLEHYEAHFDRYSPERKRAAWRDEVQPGSGILFDLGPHLIDQALQLFGAPNTIRAEIESQRKGSKVDDYFKLWLGYNGIEVVLTAGMLVKEPELRYILHGSQGSYIKYGIDPQEALLRKGVPPTAENWGKEDPSMFGLITLDEEHEEFDGYLETRPGNYMEFYNNVYNVLVKGEDVAVKPMDARNVIRMIELAFESNTLKKELEVRLAQ